LSGTGFAEMTAATAMAEAVIAKRLIRWARMQLTDDFMWDPSGVEVGF